MKSGNKSKIYFHDSLSAFGDSFRVYRYEKKTSPTDLVDQAVKRRLIPRSRTRCRPFRNIHRQV
jgi:hypothetical protein